MLSAWIAAGAVLCGAGACASHDPGAPGAPERVRQERFAAPAGDPAARSAWACRGLGEGACRANPACQVVRGARVEARPGPDGTVYCLKPRAVIGCTASQECEEELSYFCNDRGETYEVTNTCGPPGWTECPAPEPLTGSCDAR